MMAFFKRIPLGTKLLLISLLPLIFLIFLTYQLQVERQKQVNNIMAFSETMKRNGKIIKLIDYLQNERKFSYDYIIQLDSTEALHAQRIETDSILYKLQQYKDPQLQQFDQYTKINAIDSIRALVDKRSISTDAVTNYYSSLIFRLNTLTSISLPPSKRLIPLYQDLQAQKVLADLITYNTIIRANIYTILQTRQYVLEIIMGSMGAYDILKSYEKEFLVKTSSTSLQDYDTLRHVPEYSVMTNSLENIFSTFKVDSSLTAKEWWNVSEKGIDGLSALQSKIWNQSLTQLENIKQNEIREKNKLLGLVIAMLVLIIAIVLATIIVLSKMLNDIRKEAEEIAMGLPGNRLPIWSSDAVGSLAASINKINENQQKLAGAAVEIGNGNFNVHVDPRSKEDRLGNSIVSMQKSLKDFSEEMEALVKQRTEELERSNYDLQQFAHVASHDLKEPLRKIMVFSNQLEENLPLNADDKSRGYISKINKSAKRLSNMVDGILNYSIVNANDDEMEKVDLNEVVDNVFSDLELLVQQKQVEIEMESLPVIKGIPALVHQLFYNLINNALKFSKEGVTPKIRITKRTLQAAELPADMITGENELYSEIRIEDNGIGFNQEYAASLFNIFIRLHSKDKYEGTGLGLTLCKKIIDRHHGFISAEGKEGEGACFKVLLPLATSLRPHTV